MDEDVLPDDLNRRIDALAERSSLTRGRIIKDALSRGRSLAWQESWVAGVEAGLAEADRGEFASEEEIAAVLNHDRFRQGLRRHARRSRASTTS